VEKGADVLIANDKKRAEAWKREYSEESEAEDDETDQSAKKRSKAYEIIETPVDDAISDAAASENAEETTEEEGDTYDELSGRGSYLTRIFAYPVAQEFTKKSNFTMSGALDLRSAKMEVNTALNIQANGLLVKSELPVAIDLGKKQITAAPNMYTEMLLSAYLTDKDDARKLLKAANNRYLQLSLPKRLEKELDKIPLRTLMRVVPEAMDTAYAALDPEAFVSQEMDDFGRRMGAKHRISVDMKESNAALFTQVFTTEMVRLLKDKQDEKWDENVSDENYAKFLSMIDGFMKDIGNTLLSMMLQNPAGQFTNSTDVYLSGAGRILGYQQNVPLETANGNENAITLRSQTRMYNFGRPQFLINPNANDVYDVTPILEKEIDKIMDKDEEEAEAAEEVTEAASETADSVIEVVEPDIETDAK
jgi:hypothetical protein